MPRQVHPPRVVSWFVDLFPPIEQTETIQGDLLEEFSGLVSTSGIDLARRWYWRQSVKTVVVEHGRISSLLYGLICHWWRTCPQD